MTGENLAMFFEYDARQNKVKTYIYSDTPLYDASMGWYNEIKDYKYSKVKSNRIGPKTGHYTQMVWKDTKEVGIASVLVRFQKMVKFMWLQGITRLEIIWVVIFTLIKPWTYLLILNSINFMPLLH